MIYRLDGQSQRQLYKGHPLLQKLFNEVSRYTPIRILDATRNEAAQELAFHQKRSKVHFGNSAHNYKPCVAFDVVPMPLDWKNAKPFVDLGKNFVLPIAAELKIKIRWGADFNMNGDYSDDHFVDLPHYELHPWREYAAHSNLVL